MRWMLIPLMLLACGPTIHVGPVSKAPEKVAPKPKPKPLDLSTRGFPEALGFEIEIKGYKTVWLKETDLLVTLKTTRWDSVGDEADKNAREGRSTFQFERGSVQKTRTIDEGETKTVLGFKVSVSYAYEFYNEADARFVPHTKFTVRR